MGMRTWLRHSPFTKRVLLLIGAYVATVVVFACVYWLSWSLRPDFFIIHQEINLLPGQGLRLLWSSDAPDTAEIRVPEPTQGLDSISAILAEKELRFFDLQEEIAGLETLLTELGKERTEALDTLSTKANEAFEKYFEESTRGIRQQEAVMAAEIDQLNTVADQSGDSLVAANIRSDASELAVDLARLRLEIAQKESELYQQYFDERQKFLDPLSLESFDSVDARYNETQDQLSQARRDLGVLRGEISDIWSAYYANREARLGFVDFVYFSFTVSAASSLSIIN